MRVKSALMTTATDTVDDKGDEVHRPVRAGGRRDRAEEDDSTQVWSIRPATGTGSATWKDSASTPARVKAIDPSDYNSASIAIGSLLQDARP